MNQTCPCCASAETLHFTNVAGYDYYRCVNCECIFIDNVYLSRIDNGFQIVKYENGYWDMEMASARERSYGPTLARMAEAIYYCKRPINKFLDIGTGPGYFLDAVSKLLPEHADIFYGVELFPPDTDHRTKSKNYIIGDIGDLKDKFDCGICIEVIEHITPAMFNDILKKLARVSNPNALYIFNTGMPEYVIHEDRGYLDPTKRGHIVSYSIKAVSIIAARYGFVTHKIIGKTWAFALEFTQKRNTAFEDIRNRIWHAPEQNLNILSDSNMGQVLKILGLETSRAYH
jgi:SAM-dependent methyltransferase